MTSTFVSRGRRGTWRLFSRGRSWSAEDVLGVLAKANWMEAEVVAPPGNRKQPWLIRALPPVSVSGAFGAVQVGDRVLVWQRASQRRPQEASVHKLRPAPVRRPVRGELVPDPSVEQTSAEGVALDESESGEVGPTAMDTTQASQEGEDEEMKEQSQQKRLGSPSGPGAKRPAIGPSPGAKQAFNKEFSVVDTGGDGSCGYSSLAVGYHLMRGKKLDELRADGFATLGTTLRTLISEHIKRHPENYRPFCAEDWTENELKDDGKSPTCWDEWVDSLNRPRRWICQLTLRAGAKRLGCRIVVLQKLSNGAWGNPVIMGKSAKKEFPVVLGFDRPNGHYVVLVPTRGRDSLPLDWLLYREEDDVGECSQNNLRGSGPSRKGDFPASTPGSGSRSRVLADGFPDRTPDTGVQSNQGPRRRAAPKQGAAAGQVPSSAAVGDVACLHDVVPSAASASRKRARSVSTQVVPQHGSSSVRVCAVSGRSRAEDSGGTNDYVWSCGICHIELRDPVLRQLGLRRSWHIGNRHKGRCKEAGPLRTPVEVVVPSNLPISQRAWSCAYCDKGLPSLDRWTLDKSRDAQLRKEHPKKKRKGTEVAKALWENWKRDPSSAPQLSAIAKSRSVRMKNAYGQKRDLAPLGHTLVEVPVDWSCWPVEKESAKKKVTFLTCTKCWICLRGSNKGKTPCPGDRRVFRGKQLALWRRLQGNPNLQLLLDAWSVSHEEAESRILPKNEQETFDSKGHAWTKIKVAWKTWGSKKPPPILYTCPRCRSFRKDLCSFGQCQGLDRGVPDSTLQKWKALSSNPSVRTALCSTWGVSVVQASKSSFSMETGFD